MCENTGMPAPKRAKTSTWATKSGLAQMLKGGVIMDVVTPAEAKIAQQPGFFSRQILAEKDFFGQSIGEAFNHSRKM